MNYIEAFILTTASGLIGGFVSYYFAEKNEKYKFELLKQQQAVRVAELFAAWMKVDGKKLDKMAEIERADHCEKLNKITWELAIWVPDEMVVKDIMNRLSHTSNQDIKEIILKIRHQIQKRKDISLKWQDLVYFK